MQDSEIIITKRSSAKITGATGIISFSDNEAVFKTELGCLALTGTSLTVDSFDRENGVILVSGNINAAFYPSSKTEKNGDGFIKRMFSKR